MFYDCPNLSFVDVSFINGIYAYYYELFNKNISSNWTIVLNEKYYNKFKKEFDENIPSNWTVVFS